VTRYRLDLAYDGSGFRGYAIQASQRTVQGELESALAKLLGSGVDTAVAGRTDAGVHSRGQVVSFETDVDLDPEQFQRSMNGLLGPEISIRSVSPAPDDFHARFSAKWRRYRYLIDPRPSADPLLRHIVWHVGKMLDVDAMQVVAGATVGEHDFSSFCRSVEGKSNVRKVEEAELFESEGLLEFWIKANAFCHQMVRSIVGTTVDVGLGRLASTSIPRIIDALDRSKAGRVAPPEGLVLWAVGYDGRRWDANDA
jgi:tRNA pseudouridine38-40 synthase